MLHRYLCNALDKGNVGNAKTDGWDKALVFVTFGFAKLNEFI